MKPPEENKELPPDRKIIRSCKIPLNRGFTVFMRIKVKFNKTNKKKCNFFYSEFGK